MNKLNVADTCGFMVNLTIFGIALKAPNPGVKLLYENLSFYLKKRI